MKLPKRPEPFVAAVFALLGLLPLAEWIPGGHDTPHYLDILAGWWSGTLIAVGFGVVLALAAKRAPGLWREGALRDLTARADLLSPARAWLLAALACGLYVLVAWEVLGARPALIDEIVQVWQGRIYASGHLFIPDPGSADLTGVMHVVDHEGRRFGQFPAGGPAMLALGTLLHAEWLVGPVCGALALVAFARLLRATEEPRPVATGALLLMALSPFAVFMSASFMNHVTTLMWLTIGMAGTAVVVHAERPRPWMALGLGLAFGMAGSIRPVDALAFGGPAGLWLFWRALKDRSRWAECVLAGAGMAVPLIVTLWVNKQTTGHFTQFGYILLWGPSHELGFHSSPWGADHTPLRGLELLNIYFLTLNEHFLETPFPALLPAIISLALTRSWKPFDRYLATTTVLLLALYGAYWHKGFYLGPRFMYPLVPVLVLWTARLGPALRQWGDNALPIRVWGYTATIGALLAFTVGIPLRTRQYANGFLTQRWPAEKVAAAVGVHDALVFVRESWGSQLITRLWGLGIRRTESEFIYRNIDSCILDRSITRLEGQGVHGQAAIDSLLPLTADSAWLVWSYRSQDGSERIRPGARYNARCEQRLAEDARGFTVFPGLLLENKLGNVYVRDQHARDTTALAWYPDRPVYLLLPDDSLIGSPPKYHAVSRDSLFAAWQLTPPTR